MLELNPEPKERMNCYSLVLPGHQRMISQCCQHLDSVGSLLCGAGGCGAALTAQ